LAFTHWCFRLDPKTRVIRYQLSDPHRLRHCLHVPLDSKVFDGVRSMRLGGLIKNKFVPIPTGGMGSIREKKDYLVFQKYLRGEADEVGSTNYPGTKVSPLAFDGFWSSEGEVSFET